jgi:hypothetical protein
VANDNSFEERSDPSIASIMPFLLQGLKEEAIFRQGLFYEMLRATRRIIIVGCQGSGKTRLALELALKLGVAVVHLDRLYWRPGWKASDKASFRARVADAIAGESWVIDGSYWGLAFDLTLARADTLVVIDRPRLALPMAHRLAISLRSRRNAARLARRVLARPPQAERPVRQYAGHGTDVSRSPSYQLGRADAEGDAGDFNDRQGCANRGIRRRRCSDLCRMMC